MKINPFKTVAAVVISSIVWVGPALPRAEAMLVPAPMMRPEMTQDQRTRDLKTIQATLEAKALRSRLHAIGLSDQQIETRLSKMTDQEIHQFASQIRAVHPAGDALIPILVAVLLVVLIIYLIKRV
jgi:hypothetical protein